MSDGQRQGGREGGSTERQYISRDEFEVFERTTEQSFRRLTSDIGRISEKLDHLAKPPYQIMLGMLGVGVTIIALIGGLAAQPFLRDLSRQEQRVDRLHEHVEAIQTNRWTRADHERFQDQLDTRYQKLEERVNASEMDQARFRVMLDVINNPGDGE